MHTTAWLQLLVAGALEILMAAALKAADGWTRPVPGALGLAAALGSIFCLTFALKHLPIGLAYVIWTGIGAVGVTVLGILKFGDAPSLARLALMAMVVAGITGLKLLEA